MPLTSQWAFIQWAERGQLQQQQQQQLQQKEPQQRNDYDVTTTPSAVLIFCSSSRCLIFVLCLLYGKAAGKPTPVAGKTTLAAGKAAAAPF